MTGSLLEVIALDVRDAVAAEEGGADRLEIVVDMASDGLTPAVETVAVISEKCTLPQMVMLRGDASFLATPASLEALAREAKLLAEAGAAGFVFGFLDREGAVDLAATEVLIHAVAPLPWTFHRAVDHAADVQAGWRAVRLLPNLATVLTAGAPGGVPDGLKVLKTRCEAGDGPLILAGGGLRPGHVPLLLEYGVRAFHVGSAVRSSWSDPVDVRRVRVWRSLID
ncbi:copper homeostasis protein [Streptosporangium becharense]|uniref:Copper homeostasis protein cutC homolog n=1 Tax=Streptosporangium becharense TaxID=1816182 RepID=A0A7W9IEW9_9ACTN|nr:copper homeostasis protein CutC [Streptosporangium becharense]MBB2912296.1 copper homeostasis protein [Streptosporangium becharense]MBB5818843.1 copper homeostasis protein [Streptosporangium becharense]